MEFEQFTKPTVHFSIPTPGITIQYFKENPDKFYLGFSREGITLEIPAIQLRGTIETLATILLMAQEKES